MKYKIGYPFFAPIYDFKEYMVFVTIEHDHLIVKLINTLSFPTIKKKLKPGNILDNPFIFTEDSSGQVINIIFLSDLPIRYRSEATGKGLEIIVPFWSYSETNNPCNRLLFSTGNRVSNQIDSINILTKGTEIFNVSKDKWFSINYEKKKTAASTIDTFLSCLFSKIVITRYVLSTIVNSIKNDYQHSSVFSEGKYDDFYTKAIAAARNYIDSLRIEELISDLSIKVTENFGHKRGDDDRYSVFRTVSLSSSVANNDTYLKRLIGTGENEIYSDRGFCPAESMRLSGLVTGEYKREDMMKEKKAIISSYSREEHLGYLLSESISHIISNKCELEKWEHCLNFYNETLNSCFHIEKVKEFGKSLYPLNDIFNKDNPQDIIDNINKKLVDNTKCTITDREYYYIMSPISHQDSFF